MTGRTVPILITVSIGPESSSNIVHPSARAVAKSERSSARPTPEYRRDSSDEIVDIELHARIGLLERAPDSDACDVPLAHRDAHPASSCKDAARASA